MTDAFDGKAYWEKRLSEKYDLGGVGWEGLGRPYNKWAYWVKRKIFHRIISNLGDMPPSPAILDIGSGTGFYIDRWKELGFPDISGCDITETAVKNLKTKYPDMTIEQIDIGSELDRSSITSDRYEIVSCFDVLYHIVDDTSFEKAILNISNLVSPGGYFFLTDYFFRFGGFRSEHVVGRTLKEYERVLEDSGFDIVVKKPASVLFFPPSDMKSSLLQVLWHAASIPMRLIPALGHLYGLLLGPLDVLLTRSVKEGPGLEFMVCKKRA